MNFAWGLVVGIGVSIIACLIWQKIKKPVGEAPQGQEATNFNPKVEVKQENIAKLENFIARKQAGEKITNDEVQGYLNISDKTATRYLDDLERQGKIRQIGGAQKDTYYEKNSLK